MSEPVFGVARLYLGVQVQHRLFAQDTEEGTDYSAQDIHAIETDIQEKKIAFFVQHSTASYKTIDSYFKSAQEKQVPVLNDSETLQ